MTRPSDWEQASVPALSIRSRVIRIQAFAFALLLGLLIPLFQATLGGAASVVPSVAMGFVAVALALVLVRHTRVTLDRVIELDVERTGLRQAYDRARLDSLRDGLTGLGNHRAFQDELDEQVELAHERRAPLTLLLMDVDDLKKVNDSEGHAAGDQLLKAVARTINANLRRGDRGYRIGGDEFAIVLPICGPDEGKLVAGRILNAALSGSQDITFSVTIGVAAYPDPSADRQQLIHHADAALYWGKRHGRTDVQVFDPARHGVIDDERTLPEISAAVSRVANEGLLTAVYQPIYDLRTGIAVGYEGLVRPTGASTFPNAGALFAAAESARRTVELDLASAAAVFRSIGALDAGAYLSINLSPRTLEAQGFNPHELLAMARRHGVPPDQLVIEITEREAVEDITRLRTTLAVLRRFGTRIAADDVGAGNAGLRLLSEIEFDVIKVDLSLVRSGAERTPSQAVLHALQQFAKQQGRKTVAEGIETAEQLQVVNELGFDAGQGFYLARPRQDVTADQLDLAELRRGGTAEEAPAA